MSINAYLETLKSIQANILQFIDMEDNGEENYQNIIKIFEDQNIREKENEINLVIHLISKISINHHRSPNFFSKIEKILLYFKTEIKKIYTNFEIYKLFKNNNRIILFLLEEKILILDKSVYKKLNTYLNKQYFYPEIKAYKDEKKGADQKQRKDDKGDDYEDYEYSDNDDLNTKDSSTKDVFENGSYIESSDDFNIQEESYDYDEEYNEDFKSHYKSNKIENDSENRKPSINNYYNLLRNLNFKKSEEEPEINETKRMLGENDHEICEIIRNDLIEEFIIYVNKNDIPVQSNVDYSIYETNYLLIFNKITLIQYVAFYGSIQIFKYLYLNGAELDSSLWIYAIHGDDEEMIHILEENNIKPENESYIECYDESVRCHHNEMAKYIEDNYLSDEVKEYYSVKFKCIYLYNFELFPLKIDEELMYPLISCNYYYLIKLILINKCIDINKRINFTNSNFKQMKDRSTYLLSTLKTPLIIAIEKKSLDIIKLILAHSDIDVNLNEIINYQMHSNGQQRLDFNYVKEKSPLLIAFQLNDMKIINLLLLCPAIDVNNKYIKKEVTFINNNNINNLLYNDEDIKDVEILKSISLLNIGISKQNHEFVKLLLSNPKIDINSEEFLHPSSVYQIKYTPLMKAIEIFDDEIIDLLLSNSKIDVNCKMIKIMYSQVITEKNALYSAIDLLNERVAILLLSNPKIEVNTIITRTTYNKKITSKRTVLYEAVERNFIDTVKLLLQFPNIDVNIKTINQQEYKKLFSEKTALYYAVKHKRIEIVKLLLANENIDVNIESIKSRNNDTFLTKKTILYKAIENNNIEIIDLLLSNPNIDVNYKSLRINNFKGLGVKKEIKTILYRAVESNNPSIVKNLLSKSNIDVNQKSYKYLTLDGDKDGEYIKFKTPLHLAVLIKNIEIIKILLSNEKIDINVKDDHGKKSFEQTDDDEIKGLINEH